MATLLFHKVGKTFTIAVSNNPDNGTLLIRAYQNKETNAQSNLAKGRIADSSPLAASKDLSDLDHT